MKQFNNHHSEHAIKSASLTAAHRKQHKQARQARKAARGKQWQGVMA